MSKELSYQTADGHTIFTSQYLKNRGTCCKSACLHCPFGFTLKKIGMQFVVPSETEVSELVGQLEGTVEWKDFFPDNVRLIHIKGHVAGLLLKNHIIIKQLHLLPRFRDQGLSKELVESYFFN